MIRFSKTGEAEHYFITNDTIKLIKKTSKKIIGKIAEFLYEIFLESSDKEEKDKDDLDSNEEYSDEKNLDEKNSDEKNSDEKNSDEKNSDEKNSDEKNSNGEYSDEESKVFTDQTSFSNDVYEISLHLFNFNNHLTQKVEFLQNLIWSLYRNLNSN